MYIHREWFFFNIYFLMSAFVLQRNLRVKQVKKKVCAGHMYLDHWCGSRVVECDTECLHLTVYVTIYT